jgi:hypothetical protein
MEVRDLRITSESWFGLLVDGSAHWAGEYPVEVGFGGRGGELERRCEVGLWRVSLWL